MAFALLKNTVRFGGFSMLLGLSVTVQADPSYSELSKQLNARNVAILEMQNRINAQDETIRNLQGSLQDLSDRLQKLESAASQTSSAAVASGVSVTKNDTEKPVQETKSDKPVVSSGASSDDAKALYEESFGYVRANDYKKAENGFNSLIKKYPDSDLVPNSYYWLGQILYKQKDYQKSRENFLNVTKFKDSPKRSDSIYKLGLIEENLKNIDKAKKFYQVVIKTYPGTTEAVLAKKSLDRLK